MKSVPRRGSVWLGFRVDVLKSLILSHTLPRRGTDSMARRTAFQMANDKWKMTNDQ